MKILTLFARHGADKYRDVDLKVRRYLEEKLSPFECRLTIIDAALPEGSIESRADDVTVIGSSNADWEFGAWKTGLEFHAQDLFHYDYVHFVTSALYNGYIDFHGFLSIEMLRLYHGRAVALGHIEVYNDPVAFRGVRFQAWLRSSYIFLPASEVVMLKNPVTVSCKSDVFSGDPKSPFLADGDVNSRYAYYLNAWLTGEGTGQGVKWHSRFDLDAASLPFFEAKAKAILNEMSLSNRLRAQGCSLVDMTWLHRRMSRKDVPSVLPHWHDQLMDRGTGHELILEGAR